MFEIPILLNVFNRADLTEQILNRIREVKPKVLYVHADGPRLSNQQDKIKCNAVREHIKRNVDWECDLHLLFREENLGCGIGPASAITWFFNNVEYGIILEDDCLPHMDFFLFCKEMLLYYKDDVRISSIAGSNFQDGRKWGKGSYYFSRHNRIWGWATWRRTWEHYDYYLNDYNLAMFGKILDSNFRNKKERQYWMRVYDMVKKNRMNESCWDYQFMFMQWRYGGLTITPNVNLISNVGSDEDATHTNWENNPNLHRKVESILPIVKNNNIKVSNFADGYYVRKYILGRVSLVKRILRKLNRLVRCVVKR